MTEEERCLSLLGTPYQVRFRDLDNYHVYSEQLGGQYVITDRALAQLGAYASIIHARLRHYIWSHHQQGVVAPKINSSIVTSMNSFQYPPFEKRAMDALAFIASKNLRLGGRVDLAPDLPLFSTIIGADTGADNNPLSSNELSFFKDYLAEQGWVDASGASYWHVGLTPKGVIELDKRRDADASTSQCFVAMWFDDSMVDAYDKGVVPAVQSAGYKAFRVDRHDHGNRIDDEIIAQIRRSRFLVADFTCARTENFFLSRGGVYFEAGFAQGLGIPVIWTARKDCEMGLHFDTRQYPHILWQTTDELREKLQHTIEARVGRGPGATATMTGGDHG